LTAVTLVATGIYSSSGVYAVTVVGALVDSLETFIINGCVFGVAGVATFIVDACFVDKTRVGFVFTFIDVDAFECSESSVWVEFIAIVTDTSVTADQVRTCRDNGTCVCVGGALVDINADKLIISDLTFETILTAAKVASGDARDCCILAIRIFNFRASVGSNCAFVNVVAAAFICSV
jgi:hypothetical protein